MQSIKFSSQNSIEKEFVITLKKRISDYFKQNSLSTKANAAMIFKTIILLNLYIPSAILA